MPKDIRADLEKVLEYLKDSEETHYQEWLNDDDRIGEEASEGHIYESVLAIKSWLNEQK